MRTGVRVVIASTAIILGSGAALAAETIRYAYDALGRVIITDSRRTDGTGYAAGYTFDKASNRTRYTNSVAAGTGLASGGSLAFGQSLVSPASGYRLTLQFDGNLVVYAGPLQPLWGTNTFNTSNAHLDMQSDGNLVLYEGGSAVWVSYTQGHPGAYLKLQDDGKLVVYDVGGTKLWST